MTDSIKLKVKGRKVTPLHIETAKRVRRFASANQQWVDEIIITEDSVYVFMAGTKHLAAVLSQSGEWEILPYPWRLV